MDRFTHQNEYGNADIIGVNSPDLYDGLDFEQTNRVTAALNRLAAYEDTGMEPEEFDRLCREMSDIRMSLGLKTYEQLRKIVQDGRLVVLPCKLGNTVWYIASTMEICEAEVTGIWLDVYTNPQMWLKIKYYSRLIGEHEYKSRVDLMLGKTVFLTREEAEAALEAKEGEEHETDHV